MIAIALLMERVIFFAWIFSNQLDGQADVRLRGFGEYRGYLPPLPQIDTTPVEMKLLLKQAMQAYIVQRDELKTVIAGYPWFLDWGRDTLICLRGIIVADFLMKLKPFYSNLPALNDRAPCLI